MKQIQVKCENGIYFTDSPIDITTEEWKILLCNSDVFTKESKEMVINWCMQDGHQSTGKVMTQKYYPTLKSSPYNGIVDGLSTRILKYLNRFEVKGINSKNSKFIIPFEGWHVDYNTNKNFVWKLRDELVRAIEELGLIDNIKYEQEKPLTTVIEVNDTEGTKKRYFTTKYERSIRNRNAAIKKHGAICAVCGFDFEKVYGELGKGFIEVHHNKALSSLDEPVEIDPDKDMDCVCCNCHRMLHRRQNQMLTVKQLKNILKKVKSKNNENI